MKIALSAFLALGIIATPVTAWASAEEASAVPAVQDPQALPLAREFIALLYPDAARASLEQLRTSTSVSLEMIADRKQRLAASNAIERIVAKATPIVERRMPALMDAYAAAYAREYSVDELRQLIAFGATPAGKHFLDNRTFADKDPAVNTASSALSEEIMPLFEDFTKVMCRQAAEARLAAGDKNAKCNRA